MNTISNNITVRNDKDLKKNVDILFKNLGTNTDSAMAPDPNKELLSSLKEVEDYKSGKIQLPKFNTTEELFNYLDN